MLPHKVAGLLANSLPAASAACWSMLARTPLDCAQHLQQQQQLGLIHAVIGHMTPNSTSNPQLPAALYQQATAFSTSTSHSGSTDHQQQQHQQQQDSHASSSSGGGGDRDDQQGQQKPGVQQQAQEMSKAFLTKSFDMEELWMSAVGGKLKVWSARAHPELKGQEQEVLERVHAEYLDTLTRAATGRVLTNRSRSQLKQACLTAATYRVLCDVVPSDHKAVEEHIADCMGGLYAPFLLGGLKFSSWVRRLLLRQSSISQAVDTLHTIARDMEGACHCSVQPLCCASDSDTEEPQQQHDDVDSAQQQAAATASPAGEQSAAASSQQQQQEQEEDGEARAAAEAAAWHHSQHEWQLGAALTVDSCMFAEVLQSEGVPQLLRYFCCQHNMSWLEAYQKQGVGAHLEACIAKGDSCCRMTVTPADQ